MALGRRYASGGGLSIDVANSAIPALTPSQASAYPTLGAATSIAPVSNTSRPFSSAIGQVPMSALSGGAGSNGVIASINNQGVPSGSPSAPTTISNSAFTPPMAAPSSNSTSNGQAWTSLPANIGSQAAQLGLWNVNHPSDLSSSAQQDFLNAYNALQAGQSPSSAQGYTQLINMYGAKKGGRIEKKKFANGGIPTSEALDPWYTRAEERGMMHPEGLIASTGAGRTDVHNINVPSGSYIVPADVVSGLAEGNTLSGASVIDRMMHSNPYGIQGGGRHAGMGPPRAPRPFQEPSDNFKLESKGGRAGTHTDGGVPIVIAGGEFLLHPQTIIQKFGSLKKGHAALDAFVKRVRADTVKTLRKLPGPKK